MAWGQQQVPQEPEASLHRTLRPRYAAAASEMEGGTPTQVLAGLAAFLCPGS